MIARRLFEWFYLVTPAFALVDWVWGVPARAAGIPSPTWRAGYYALLMGCWLLCRKAPEAGPFVGIVESSVNLLLLFLAVLLPIWSAAEGTLPLETDAALSGPGVWLNLLISGPLLILAIKSNERAIARRLGVGRSRA
ncbi:MAG: hypothetical protein HKN73_11925 [Gemmatimonadetes bacterium]|nr:hypothetical protein [Gemmatimonadota bacterium]